MCILIKVWDLIFPGSALIINYDYTVINLLFNLNKHPLLNNTLHFTYHELNHLFAYLNIFQNKYNEKLNYFFQKQKIVYPYPGSSVVL